MTLALTEMTAKIEILKFCHWLDVTPFAAKRRRSWTLLHTLQLNGEDVSGVVAPGRRRCRHLCRHRFQRRCAINSNQKPWQCTQVQGVVNSQNWLLELRCCCTDGMMWTVQPRPLIRGSRFIPPISPQAPLIGAQTGPSYWEGMEGASCLVHDLAKVGAKVARGESVRVDWLLWSYDENTK